MNSILFKIIVCFSIFNLTRTSNELITSNLELDKIIDLLFNINDGYRVVYDYCENLNLEQGFITKTLKPDCIFNYSYIDNNSNINLFTIKEDVRTLFKEQKNNVCKSHDIECGELTIVLKIIDTINAAVNIILKDTNNINLWNNLKMIDFNEQFTFLRYAINNIEILTNITLHKTKINSEMNKIYVENIFSNINNYIGNPIGGIFYYIGNTIGQTGGVVIEKILPEIGSDTKIIILIIFIILLKRM